ncbi:MAG TPA: ribosome biogenesis GTP-binding protein YihA/YsxC [Salinivirgaceae bacterium]|nr:ribosome biogenesis GTP-binding protein YihA/YsxC [Salinivirgaceae bacterium]
MQLYSIEYTTSGVSEEQYPKDKKPEIAFIGRSNVGKSSLINFLTGKKELAKTSQTPGKTQTLNFFLVNQQWYLVDMPGYGYAQQSQRKKNLWNVMIKNYILKRENLQNLFVLVDSRHAPLENDIQFINWLGEEGIPFALVFTKIDKLSASQLRKNLQEYTKRLLEDWETLPPIFTTSTVAKFGKEELLNYIERILETVKQSK